jgi:hypothetical protein
MIMTTPEWAEEYVERDGLIFRSGSYEAQGFSLTPEELAAAAADFTPVPVELEHTLSKGGLHILDGHLGQLKAVRVGADGASLFGTVALPRWLDRRHRAEGGKVSASWDRGRKRLLALGVVFHPAVKDAAIFSDFAAAHPDAAATFAAAEPAAVGELTDGADLATFTARKTHDLATEGHQRVHDAIAQAWPGICAGAPFPADPPEPAAFGDRPKQLKALQQQHALAVEHGAACPGAPITMSEPEPEPEPATREAPGPKGKFMTWLNPFKSRVASLPDDATPKDVAALFAEEGAAAPPAAEPPPPPAAPPPPVATFADSPEAKAMRAELDRLKADREADRKARVAADAATFADAACGAKGWPKAARDALAAVHAVAAEAGHLAAVATFADEAKAPLVGLKAAVEALVAALPRNPMAGPRLDGDPDGKPVRVLFAEAPPKAEDDAAEIDRLMRLTPTGRAIAEANALSNGRK